MDEEKKFSDMEVQLAMYDLEPFFGENKALRVTTRMALTGVPISKQNQWVKEKLFLSESKEYWKGYYKKK